MKEPITIPAELMHLTTQELANQLGCSRQYIGKLKRKAQGLCMECNKAATVGVMCAGHAKVRRRRTRKKTGNKAWKPGRRGRPPLDKKEAPIDAPQL